jgi:hypothetical protein
MPKLRAIDFNKIKNGNFEEAKRVVKDLLMLTPRGPQQNQRGNAYFKFECHPGKEAILKTHASYVAAQENADGGEVPVYNFGWSHNRAASWWGYTDEQLYYTAKALGSEGTWLGESDFRNMLMRHFGDEGYSTRGAKLTRGSRRLHNRFHAAWKGAISGGKLGDLAFKCRVATPKVANGGGYYGPTTQTTMDISFAGRTAAEAKMMLTTMLGHAVDDVDVDFSAWQAAEPAEILQKNMAQIASLEESRIKAKRQLEQIQQFLSNLDTLEEAVQMYSMTICE